MSISALFIIANTGENANIYQKENRETNSCIYIRGLFNNKIYLYAQQHGWMDGWKSKTC